MYEFKCVFLSIHIGPFGCRGNVKTIKWKCLIFNIQKFPLKVNCFLIELKSVWNVTSFKTIKYWLENLSNKWSLSFSIISAGNTNITALKLHPISSSRSVVLVLQLHFFQIMILLYLLNEITLLNYHHMWTPNTKPTFSKSKWANS